MACAQEKILTNFMESESCFCSILVCRVKIPAQQPQIPGLFGEPAPGGPDIGRHRSQLLRGEGVLAEPCFLGCGMEVTGGLFSQKPGEHGGLPPEKKGLGVGRGALQPVTAKADPQKPLPLRKEEKKRCREEPF